MSDFEHESESPFAGYRRTRIKYDDSGTWTWRMTDPAQRQALAEAKPAPEWIAQLETLLDEYEALAADPSMPTDEKRMRRYYRARSALNAALREHARALVASAKTGTKEGK